VLPSRGESRSVRWEIWPFRSGSCSHSQGGGQSLFHSGKRAVPSGKKKAVHRESGAIRESRDHSGKRPLPSGKSPFLPGKLFLRQAFLPRRKSFRQKPNRGSIIMKEQSPRSGRWVCYVHDLSETLVSFLRENRVTIAGPKLIKKPIHMCIRFFDYGRFVERRYSFVPFIRPSAAGKSDRASPWVPPTFGSRVPLADCPPPPRDERKCQRQAACVVHGFQRIGLRMALAKQVDDSTRGSIHNVYPRSQRA